MFYHLGHEVAEDAKDYMTDLQHKVQKVRFRSGIRKGSL